MEDGHTLNREQASEFICDLLKDRKIKLLVKNLKEGTTIDVLAVSYVLDTLPGQATAVIADSNISVLLINCVSRSKYVITLPVIHQLTEKATEARTYQFGVRNKLGGYAKLTQP